MAILEVSEVPTGGLAPDVEVAHARTGQGPAVMLVAGTGYSGATWPDRVVQALATRGYAAITFDHRGTGKTPGTTEEYSTRLFARDALRLLESMGIDSVFVIGHSMGGRVAQWMAIEGGPRVRGLVLASTGAGPLPGRRSKHVTGVPVDVAQSIAEQGYEAYIRTHQRRTFFTEEFFRIESSAVRWLGDAFWNSRPSLRDYLKHVSARQSHNTLGRLSEITQPALVLVGDLETHSGGTGSHIEQSRYLHAELPSSEFKMLGNVKHGYFWERPDEVMEEITGWIDRYL